MQIPKGLSRKVRDFFGKEAFLAQGGNLGWVVYLSTYIGEGTTPQTAFDDAVLRHHKAQKTIKDSFNENSQSNKSSQI